jgi:DNA-binding NarL/FixJ family response regulator
MPSSPLWSAEDKKAATPFGGRMIVQVGLVTKEPVVAAGFAALLSEEPGFAMTAVIPDLKELRQKVKTLQLDVILVDVENQLDCQYLFELIRQWPGRNFVLWAHSIPPAVALEAMSAGIKGILRRTLSPALHRKCVAKVAAGDLWFEKELLHELVSMKRKRLSRRESQLVLLVSQGAKNKEIATRLFLSEGTVKVYLSRLFRKLELKDRYELALYGLKNFMGEKADLDHVSLAEEEMAGALPGVTARDGDEAGSSAVREAILQ